MNSFHKLALASLALMLFAVAPASASASRTATSARSHDFTYRDRTPHVHDGTPRQHRDHHKS